jgi:clorobiocin biosynthesis protein CloN4
VAGATGAVSYRDLDGKANALAVRMRALGVARGDRVVIWAEKSPDVVVAMQAVLRLGAAYVPVDPATPVARASGRDPATARPAWSAGPVRNCAPAI